MNCISSDLTVIGYLYRYQSDYIWLKFSRPRCAFHKFFLLVLSGFFEVLKVMPEPDGTDTTTRDKNALFTQLVADPVLVRTRECDSIINNKFSCIIGVWIRCLPTMVCQRVNVALIGQLSPETP